jgi:DHA2 family multidrug resistance protein-like MFS transporter
LAAVGRSSAAHDVLAAAGGLQGTARLTGQTAGAVLMTTLFTLAPLSTAPRTGLGVGAILALAAGLVSLLRSGATATPRAAT